MIGFNDNNPNEIPGSQPEIKPETTKEKHLDTQGIVVCMVRVEGPEPPRSPASS